MVTKMTILNVIASICFLSQFITKQQFKRQRERKSQWL